MSRKKRFKQYKEGEPKAPRPPGRLPSVRPPVYVPDPYLQAECTALARDQTRYAPCVRGGRIINSPGTSIAMPPDRGPKE